VERQNVSSGTPAAQGHLLRSPITQNVVFLFKAAVAVAVEAIPHIDLVEVAAAQVLAPLWKF
jgi:hypothetical protein